MNDQAFCQRAMLFVAHVIAVEYPSPTIFEPVVNRNISELSTLMANG
jgi:hypothetical protein